MSEKAPPRVTVHLIRASDGIAIGEADYLSVPQIGSVVVFNGNDLEAYSVTGVEHWFGSEFREPRAFIYVEYRGPAR